jgi:hypothetical protein
LALNNNHSLTICVFTFFFNKISKTIVTYCIYFFYFSIFFSSCLHYRDHGWLYRDCRLYFYEDCPFSDSVLHAQSTTEYIVFHTNKTQRLISGSWIRILNISIGNGKCANKFYFYRQVTMHVYCVYLAMSKKTKTTTKMY